MGPEAPAVNDRARPQISRLVRPVSLLISLGLIAWASSDDPSIGGATGFGWTQGALLGVGVLLAASCLAPHSWNARALAAVLSTALTLGVAELGLRMLVSSRYTPPFQLDERTLYALVPGAHREHRLAAINGGARIPYRINAAGFRGEELDPRHAALRIVVYGDSFVQGEFSTLPNTFAERLERHLSEQLGAPVEVVNAGVAGYGPDQILRKMEAELESLEPELVVVALFAGNDFGDLVRNKLYRLDSSGKLLENHFVIAPSLRRQMETARSQLLLKRILRDAVQGVTGVSDPNLPDESSSPGEKMEWYLEHDRREYREYVVEGDDVVRELMRDPYNADVSLTPDSESARYKIQLMDAVLARIKQLADGHRVPLLLALIPDPIDVGGHETGEVDPRSYPEHEPGGLTQILARSAARHGIPYVDLFGTFRERGGTDLYFRGLDDHWNDLGQDLAAETVAGVIASSGFLDGSER